MEVTLKSNGWYNKLQKFTFGKSKPELYSLCPFFWLTIFCIVALPFTLILKGILWVANRIDKYIDKSINEYLDSLTPLEIGTMYNDYIIPRKPFFAGKIGAYSMYNKWKERQLNLGKSYDDVYEMAKNAHDKWEEDQCRKQEILDQIYRDREELERKNQERLAKKNERAAKMKLVWIPIVTWTKRIFNLALTCGIMILITWFINFIIVIYNPSATLEGLKIFGIVLLLLGAIFGIVVLGTYYVDWNRSNGRVPVFLRPFVAMGPMFTVIADGIGSVFKWIGKGFKNTFGLFWEYFKANKNDYCPAINWVDDETEENN